MENAEDLRATVGIGVPTELIDAVAERVAILLAKELGSEPERWIGVEQAAFHLACQSRGSMTSYQAAGFEWTGDFTVERVRRRRDQIDGMTNGVGRFGRGR